MKNIVLVGFMGTGKTVIAKRLAVDLGRAYVSTDDLIKEKEGRKISDIFRDSGEEHFREKEREVVEEVSNNTDQIIDTGGGIVLDAKNMENLRKNGLIVCLWATPEVIYERTKKYRHRPLLSVNDPEGKIKELLDLRRSFYEKADMHIDTTELSPVEIVKEIKNAEMQQED